MREMFYNYINSICFRSFLLTFLLMLPSVSFSQVSLDEPRRNQFMVAATGIGDLQPDTYYDIFHRTYRDEAAMTSKGSYATSFNTILRMQDIPSAKSIDSTIVKRFATETKKALDRSNDWAWATYRDRIEGKLERYKDLVNKISRLGGSLDDYHIFDQEYTRICAEVRGIQDAYMDTGKRASEYEEVYQEIILAELELFDYLKKQSAFRQIDKAYSAFEDAIHKKNAIGRGAVDASLTRWQNAFAVASRITTYSSTPK